MKSISLLKIILLIYIICTNSCQQPRSYSNPVNYAYKDTTEFCQEVDLLVHIDIRNAKSLSCRDFVEDFVSDVYFLQLSSRELIGEINSIFFYDNKIYILDKYLAKKVFIFDMEGGLIKIIDSQGGGPGEYLGLGDISIDEYKNELIVSDCLYPKFLHYNLSGDFICETKTVANFTFMPYDNDVIFNSLAYKQMESYSGKYSALLACKDSIVSRSGFSYYPIQKDVAMEISFFKNTSKELLYIPLLCDTIYQLLSDTSYRAKYVVDQDRSLWNKRDEDLPNDEMGRAVVLNNYTALGRPFLENNDFCYFSMKEGYDRRILQRPYFYNKKNKSVYYFDFGKFFDRDSPFKNGLFIVANPMNVYNDYFVAPFDPASMPVDAKILNKSYLNLIESADENTNLALVFYKFNIEYE